MPLLTVRLPGNATLADALRKLQLTIDDVDAAFGLVAVDPEQNLYALRVTDTAAARMATNGQGDVEIFADPRIEPGDGEPKPYA